MGVIIYLIFSEIFLHNTAEVISLLQDFRLIRKKKELEVLSYSFRTYCANDAKAKNCFFFTFDVWEPASQKWAIYYIEYLILRIMVKPSLQNSQSLIGLQAKSPYPPPPPSQSQILYSLRKMDNFFTDSGSCCKPWNRKLSSWRRLVRYWRVTWSPPSPTRASTSFWLVSWFGHVITSLPDSCQHLILIGKLIWSRDHLPPRLVPGPHSDW